MTTINNNQAEKPTMQISMEKCIAFAKDFKVKEEKLF